MLRIIAVGILAMMLILAVGCRKTSESIKEEDADARGPVLTEDGVAQDRVFVEFTAPSGDSRVLDLLDSLGSHIIETVYYGNRVQVSVPEDRAVADIVQSLNSSPLVEYAEPNYYAYI
jgi:hypothetical protein